MFAEWIDLRARALIHILNCLCNVLTVYAENACTILILG